MGRLITKAAVDFESNWYCKDASRYNGHYAWPSEDFPFRLHIHSDVFENANEHKIAIRRWIERTISDTVVYDMVEMDYRRFYGKSRDWADAWDIRNRWYRFSFEDEHSASMFALTFSQWIRPMTKWHPDKPEDEEYLSKPVHER